MSDLGAVLIAIVVGTILNLFVIYGAYREGWRNGALSGYRTGVRNLTGGIPHDNTPEPADRNLAALTANCDHLPWVRYGGLCECAAISEGLLDGDTP